MKQWFKKGIVVCFVLGVLLAFSPRHLTQAAESEVSVYRLYLPANGEHLYTTDAYEASVLTLDQGWQFEGIGWYAPSTGIPVYRLYNPGLMNHLYTTDNNEVRVLTETAGWVLDNGGNPLFYSGGSVGIYRLYNQELNGMHLLTTDLNEYQVLPGYGWAQEGESVWCVRKGSSDVSTKYEMLAKAVWQLTNQQRAENGCSALAFNEALYPVASLRAQETTTLFSHTRPNGTSCFTAIDEAGISYTYAGENIAYGQSSPASVVDAWMNSPGHRANILGINYSDMAVGVAQDSAGRYYWVQMFMAQ